MRPWGGGCGLRTRTQAGGQGQREAGDPLCQRAPGLSVGLGMKEIGKRKFPRGAWPPCLLVPGAETFH